MIDKTSLYFKQAELVVRVLPLIAKYDCFALKGGTAINLFVQNMPRLSVDIDLTYLPIQQRDESLANIESALKQIASDIEKYVPGSMVKEIPTKKPQMVSKLHVFMDDIQIKIEPNLVIRGTVFSYENRDLSPKAKQIFEMSASMRVVSLSDLYGGKICAALDRQHPRDLYDIRFVLSNEGISEQIWKGFLAYLISHDRPIHESLDPILKDVRDIYETDFQGMVDDDVPYEELIQVREKLIRIIKQKLTKNDKEFLISFKRGEPKWPLLGINGVEHLPAVRWKLFNIQKMDSAKRIAFVEKLRRILN
ncbi:MAG: nucleotidyl transferase AbiEii/AbiGii toxin family protein [Candidatus Omnitrophica bacterium]|nr:nucleotidyl transferase AbiEii/AbiGii toxin family protein [Candidatus Omnitrophota bacterium]